MKAICYGLAVTILSVQPALAQERARFYSHPAIPPEGVLDRLNLRLAWRTVVPTYGKCDGLFSVQVLDQQILVQNVSGGITAINPVDGSIQWHTVFGVPFRTNYILGYNAASVYAYNGLRLFSLDRRTGVVRGEFTPFDAPTAAPVADNDRAYLTLSGGRLDAYLLRTASAAAVAATPPPTAFDQPVTVSTGTTAAPGEVRVAVPLQPGEVQPRFAWTFPASGRLERAPAVGPDSLLSVDTNGNFVSLNKESPIIINVYNANSPLSGPLAQYADVAYAVTLDSRAVATRILTGNVLWQVSTRSAILRKPAVTDRDVYLATNGGGLSRLNRQTGEEIWYFPAGDRFVAMNPVFVYAIDRVGALVVLDRARGTALSGFDARDFPVAVVNDVTDRIYLAAHDGTLVCFYDRAFLQPYPVRQGERAALAATAPPTPPPPPRAKPSEAGEGPPPEK
jgi:outer membrane protein assembly factor BamB